MKFWLLYSVKHVVLLVMLLATALFLIRYPVMWDASVTHIAASPRLPMWLFPVARAVLPVGFVFMWFAYCIASRRIGRPQ
jgi:hypothetical protein